jgi:hypothetical protein
LSAIEYPLFFTPAEVETARGYLTACVQYWKDVDDDEFAALPAEQVIDRVLRLWPQGWDHFREYFAADIRAAERAAAEEHTATAAWLQAAEQATRVRVFPRQRRLVALEHQMFYPTPAAAVCGVDALIATDRADGLSWREIASRLGTSPVVVIAWSVQARVRAGLARIARPISTSVFQ